MGTAANARGSNNDSAGRAAVGSAAAGAYECLLLVLCSRFRLTPLRSAVSLCVAVQVNYVSKIALLSGIHLSLVTKCVRQLLYYQAIQVVDIFQFSNRYANTEALATKCRGGSLWRKEANGTGAANADADADDAAERARALRNDMRSVARLDPSRPRPPFHVLFRILCALNPHVTLAEVFRNLDTLLPEFASGGGGGGSGGQPSDGSAGASSAQVHAVTLESLNIHPRKLIQFATINGLLRRVYQYPILVGHLLAGQSIASSSHAETKAGSQQQPLGASTVGDVDLSFFGLLHGRQHLLEDALARHLAAQAARAASRAAAAAAAMVPLTLNMGASAEAAETKGMFRTTAGTANATAGVAGGNTEAASAAAVAAAAGQASATATVSGKHPTSSPQPLAPNASFVPMAPALAPASTSAFLASFRQLERYLDGEHHTDELCCMFGRSFAQIEEEIRRSKKCILVNK